MARPGARVTAHDHDHPPGAPHRHDDDHHGHGHGHDHGHGHTHGLTTTRALTVALVLNGGFLGIEAGVGWWTGSLALLSDALHMVSDVGSLVLALGAARLAQRAADAKVTFGLRRFETLGALANGVALFAAVGFIAHEAVSRLMAGPAEIAGLPVLIVGFIGLVINVGSAVALARSDHGNLNIRGALAHMIADALGSVGAMAAAVCMMWGYPAADPIISLLLAGVVAWGAWSVTREASSVLLQLPPPGFDVNALLADLRGLRGVRGVHDVHVWTLDGREPIVTAHLVSDGEVDHDTLVASARTLAHDKHDVDHGTFQVESDGSDCGLGACGVH